MTESKLRLRRCCFTGHRPEKLHETEEIIKAALERSIKAAITDGFSVFISGVARGVDIWAAEIVLRLRAEGLPIRLNCASPYRGFEKRWSTAWQERYLRVMNSADLVRFICPAYSRDCFQKRNEWMVNHAARVIAVYHGGRGGTKNTIDYAQKNGVAVEVIGNLGGIQA